MWKLFLVADKPNGQRIIEEFPFVFRKDAEEYHLKWVEQKREEGFTFFPCKLFSPEGNILSL